jgi:hypothetical protein
VVQSAVLAVEDGLCDNPADRLNKIKERFLIYVNRSSFTWALRLRAYDKKIRNNTTSFGYIHWSDDHETLYYKNLKFRINDLRKLIRAEVELL